MDILCGNVKLKKFETGRERESEIKSELKPNGVTITDPFTDSII